MNKDFSVTITLTAPITAASQAQAEERAEMLKDGALDGVNALKKRWAGDVEGDSEVEEA